MNNLLISYPVGTRRAVFIRREKRFFIYAELDGEIVIAHTNNTGSMMGLLRRGSGILLSPANNPNRKLKWTLEAIQLHEFRGDFWVGVNTSVPNRLLAVLLEKKLCPWGNQYTMLTQEAVNGESRLDGKFYADDLPDLWVECKNVTLAEDGVAAFPDAVTTRGAKHLHTLIRLVKDHSRAAMLYVIQRPDVQCFAPADYIDPAYAQVFYLAVSSGVEVYPLQVSVQEKGIFYDRLLPYFKADVN